MRGESLTSFDSRGTLAHLVEQLTFNQSVTGSSPVRPTNFIPGSSNGWTASVNGGSIPSPGAILFYSGGNREKKNSFAREVSSLFR